MTDKPIDIIQQFADQGAREQMLAFFEFTVPHTGNLSLSGLCKISRPKGDGAKLEYLSLTFMVDTPDDAARSRVDDALGALDGASLHAGVPQIVEALPMPSIDAGSENYVRQVDLLVDEHLDASQLFIERQLIPAICGIAGIALSEAVWWDGQGAGSGASLQYLKTHLARAKK